MANLPNTSGPSRTRRAFRAALVLAVAMPVTACSVIGGDDVRSVYQLAKWAVQPAPSVTLQQASAVPYASLGLRVGDSTQIMILLATKERDQMMWTSAEHIAILTDEGRIVRTAGLGHDLGGIQSLRTAEPNGTSGTVRWTADYPDLKMFAVPITCTVENKGEETIVILGNNFVTRRIEEHCRADSDQLDWSFTNVFWKDPGNGFVWKSLQHVNPKLDSLEIEVLRPPA